MKAHFWLSVFLILAIAAGCATTKENKKEQALRVRKLGEAFLAEKKYSSAYRELMNALALDPQDAHTHYALGIFYYEKKNYNEAIAEYRKAITLKPDFASARNNLGVVYMDLKEWDKAIATLTPITEDYIYATPHFPHFLIGQAFFHKQNFPRALEHFQEALELQPDFYFASHWLGQTYLELGNTKQAIRSLEDAVRKMPGAAIFLFDLGRAYERAGSFTKAEEAYGKAASLATDEALKESALKQQRLMRKKSGGR